MGVEWLIIAIIVSVVVIVGVLLVTTVVPAIQLWWSKESSPPPKPPENIESPEPPEEKPTPVPSPAVAPSTNKVSEYLGNSNTMEIHDLSNIKPACQINRMNEENKIFFDNIEEAKKSMESKGYDGCRWCLSQYHTD